MRKQNMVIWGRAFELDACLECYPGETVLEQQEEALEALLAADGLLDQAAEAVEALLRRDAAASGESILPGNLFRYVMPQSIYIPRKEDKRVAAVLCDYRLDMEHGLAIVFENEQFRSVVRQDEIL